MFFACHFQVPPFPAAQFQHQPLYFFVGHHSPTDAETGRSLAPFEALDYPKACHWLILVSKSPIRGLFELYHTETIKQKSVTNPVTTVTIPRASR